MLILLCFVFLSATVWMASRRIVMSLENLARQLTPQVDKQPTNLGDRVSPLREAASGSPAESTSLLELQLQLAAIHRVLLDGLKPEWWIKLTKKMQEFEESPKPEDTGEHLENHHRRVKRESEFAREISALPLHAVDATLWAWAKEAGVWYFRESDIWEMINNGKGSLGEAQFLLRECEEADRLYSQSPSVGQHDLIEWFRKNVTSAAHEQRNFLELKLKEFIEANAQPKK
jgi:hypothetical protein